MTAILTDTSTAGLVQAVWEDMLGMGQDLALVWPACKMERSGGVARWHSPLPIGYIFNAAASLREPQGDETAVIDETAVFFRSNQAVEFDWWVPPGMRENEWGRQLTARGFTLQDGPAGMAVGLDELPEENRLPAGVHIRKVETSQDMSVWTHIFCLGFGTPPTMEGTFGEFMQATLAGMMTSYLAWVDGQPVATASLYCGAGAAGIYCVATLPDWRGRGIGGAVTLQALLDGRARGLRIGTLQASELGLPVYLRLGFRDLFRMKSYNWKAETAHQGE